MIRPLHPLDIARYVLLGSQPGSNRVLTLDSVGGKVQPQLSLTEAARLSLSLQRKHVCSLVRTEGRQIHVILSARPRSGPRSWEVSHLLARAHSDEECSQLLGRLCHSVARREGEKVFIRLRDDDPLVDVLRSCGFLRCSRESLYRGPARPASNRRFINLRQQRPSDAHDLFLLYNATTPSETRFLAGMTLRQWSSSRERYRGRTHDFVYEYGGTVKGQLTTVRRLGVGQLAIVVHPDDDDNISPLVDYGLDRLTGVGTVYCMVPRNHVLLRRVLSQRGYEMVSDYVTLVRTMVVPVAVEDARQPVSIASA